MTIEEKITELKNNKSFSLTINIIYDIIKTRETCGLNLNYFEGALQNYQKIPKRVIIKSN